MVESVVAKPGGPPNRLLDFWSIGWVLLLALAMCVGVVWMWFTRLPQRMPTVGDGRRVASYQFDLSTSLIPSDEIVAAGFPKDGLPAMVEPAVFTRDEAELYARELRKAHQGKFLVDGDRVIGVCINGAARAYPISILNWHEVVNDTLGGVPIVVTYNPLCDSAVVFERRVGGETLTFGVSGLVYNSNLLMYDRQPGGKGESLWSQLQFRAVTGPAAARGERLTLVPAALLHWADWQAAHPDASVLAPDRSRSKIYKRTYQPYFGDDKLRFDVSPLPPDRLPRKTPVLAVRAGDAWRVFKWPEILRDSELNKSPDLPTTIDGVQVRLHVRRKPDVMWATREDGEPLQTVSALWFAWYAMHSDAGVP